MDSGIRNLSSRCLYCSQPFMSLSRGSKVHVCDACFRTTNGRIAELNAYCNEHPGAELIQISRALHIGLSDVISLINYSDAMNEKPSINPITEKINAARKFYNDEMDQRKHTASNRDNSSKLLDDLKRFRRQH
ncbi:MAG: hypothetical protein OSJ45_04760 [Lachnospiraceae bacterium]|nr:hypothetical protein [Lachnospiraceae bacterium]